MAQPAGQAFFNRIPTSGDSTAEQCKALYDEWASTYDQDLLDPSHDYVGPTNAAKAILQHRPNNSLSRAVVLDAGCGTGLSGIAVQQAAGNDSNVIVDGMDISQGMLDVAAKRGIYRNLTPADLTKPLDIPEATYDVVVCVGTLTGGHVGPVPALGEFVRVVKGGGGLVVATVKESVWASDGYEGEVRRLEREGKVEVRSTDAVPYRAGQGVDAVMLVLRKV